MWNKIAALTILVTVMSLLLIPFEIEARGGGGRGGGSGRAAGGARSGGGSAYRGGQTINRTPTMSRASSRPAVSQARPQARAAVSQARPNVSPARQGVSQARPGISQARTQPSRQTLQQRPSAANRTELRNQVNQYAQSRPAQNINRQAVGQRAQDFSTNRGSQITQNRDLSNKVSDRLQQTRPNSNQWFDRNFFDRHDLDLGYVRTGANLWRPAAWATLAAWGPWSWSEPYYYDNEGYSYPLTTAESTYDYSYNTPTTVQTVPVQMAQPVQSAQAPATNEGEWLPLGVFAVARDAKIADQTNHFIQLAVSRSGEIAGVLYNSATDAAQDLAGTINHETQKAYWSLTNQPGAPVASTGLYNLTEDQTPINVHFSDGSDQEWTLVRLQQGK